MFIDTVAWNYQMTALNKAEAMVHPTRLGKLKGFLSSLEGLGVEVTAIEDADSAEISKIRATTNLKMPDALVLHQAQKVEGAIATTDIELARVARSRSVGVFRPS
jgi:predicted nucleic acid-binding protein